MTSIQGTVRQSTATDGVPPVMLVLAGLEVARIVVYAAMFLPGDAK